MPAVLRSVRLERNETEDFPDVAGGEIQLLFAKCLVRSHQSGVTYRIPSFRLTTRITEADIAAGIGQVAVGFHGIARIEVVDRNDEPLAREHVFGVTEPGVSLEVKGPEYGPLHVLLPPGEYLAYLAGPRPVHVEFAVREPEEDVGTIKLRDPGDSDSAIPR
ncbi:MAG TPA: hypothetical protein VJ813_09525 [Vicinamibacterales bacterium]|nr:hypothetical protein [Vicinamibacterales bacterium]